MPTKYFTSILFLTMFSAHLLSQEPFKEYDMLGTTYKIEISEEDEGKNKGQITLYIGALSSDKIISEVGLMVAEKELPIFLQTLEQAKTKYLEWKETAKVNNVESLAKEMTIESPKVVAYFHLGEWEFDYSVELSYYFNISKLSSGEIAYTLMVRTGEITSTTNEFMNCDGLIIAFTSAEEIESFLNKINLSEIEKFKGRERVDELFKD